MEEGLQAAAHLHRLRRLQGSGAAALPKKEERGREGGRGVKSCCTSPEEVAGRGFKDCFKRRAGGGHDCRGAPG